MGEKKKLHYFNDECKKFNHSSKPGLAPKPGPAEELLLHPMDLEKPFKPTFNRPQQKQPLLQDLSLLRKMNSFFLNPVLFSTSKTQKIGTHTLTSVSSAPESLPTFFHFFAFPSLSSSPIRNTEKDQNP